MAIVSASSLICHIKTTEHTARWFGVLDTKLYGILETAWFPSVNMITPDAVGQTPMQAVAALFSRVYTL